METLTGEAFLGLQLSSAVGYLHRHGVLHLDLKPSNIVAEAGRAKLIDLSVAQAPGTVKAGTGTWCYLAPEQASGGSVGPAADVWGIGVVLWEAACGHTPFGDEDVEYPQLETRAPELRAKRRLPAALAGAVDECLDPDPSGRPELAELRDALAPIAGARG
jgi:serine/threonine protein kinase